MQQIIIGNIIRFHCVVVMSSCRIKCVSTHWHSVKGWRRDSFNVQQHSFSDPVRDSDHVVVSKRKICLIAILRRASQLITILPSDLEQLFRLITNRRIRLPLWDDVRTRTHNRLMLMQRGKLSSPYLTCKNILRMLSGSSTFKCWVSCNVFLHQVKS